MENQVARCFNRTALLPQLRTGGSWRHTCSMHACTPWVNWRLKVRSCSQCTPLSGFEASGRGSCEPSEPASACTADPPQRQGSDVGRYIYM